jgi:serine/threonine-protein kinase
MATIKDYTIKSELGQGGMATVYLAEDKKFLTNVAVKVLAKEFAHNENIRKRFLAEARNMFKMSHPNIIKVSDLIDEGDTVAFVMEYIEGETLKDYLERKGKLNEEEIKAIFTQILAAVAYVHEQGLIHRDIKPSNFMISPKGQVKLLDFGIAKNTDSNSAEYTQTSTSQQMGTPMYMSPEQVNETKSVTAQSDIYSLGVVLWQMVMGQKPYDTKTISNFELQLKIVQEPLTLTHTIWDNCIQKATHKNIDSRYTSAQLFLNDLQNPESIEDDKTILKKNDEKTIFENKEEATIIENNKTQTNTPTEEKAQSTGNTTAANVEKEKKKPIGLIIGVIAGVVLLLVIIILIAKNGPSKEELAAKAKAFEDSTRMADSTAAVTAEAKLQHDAVTDANAHQKGDDDGAIVIPEEKGKGDEVVEKPDEIFLVVEETAVFPGGEAAMYKYLRGKLENNYPSYEEEAEIQGKVYVRFVIEKDGSITNADVVRKVSPGLDKLAKSTVENMPKWTPGKQGGKPIRMWFTLPVSFQLQ